MKDRQINIFDILNPPAVRGEPHFEVGQVIYLTILDTYQEYIVDSIYDLQREWGYSLDRSEGGVRTSGHNSVTCGRIGVSAFASIEDALEVVSKLDLKKLYKDELKLHSIEYRDMIRSVDDRFMQSYIAKVGTHQIYYKEFGTYRFLDRFKTQKQRDAEYKSKSEKENDIGGDPKEFDITPLIGDLYYVNENRWSDPEYARSQGNPFET